MTRQPERPAPRPFDSFWDRSYRDGSYLDHWDPPRVPAELAAVVAAGLVPLPERDGPGTDPADPEDGTGGTSRGKRTGRVLDVGCGAGVEAVYLAGLGLDVIGVDSSREALNRARERARAAAVEGMGMGIGKGEVEGEGAVDWRLGSVYGLPVDDAWADLVLDRGCLHGIDREDRPDYAREIERVLRPGRQAPAPRRPRRRRRARPGRRRRRRARPPSSRPSASPAARSSRSPSTPAPTPSRPSWSSSASARSPR